MPGPVDAQHALHLLFDRDSELIEFFVLRKLRQWPRRSGITVAATSSHELELIERVLPLFRHLRWKGPVEVELKRDERSGEDCVLEINPRFSGTLAVSARGRRRHAAFNAERQPRPLQPARAAAVLRRRALLLESLAVRAQRARDLCSADGFRLGLRDLALPVDPSSGRQSLSR